MYWENESRLTYYNLWEAFHPALLFLEKSAFVCQQKYSDKNDIIQIKPALCIKILSMISINETKL